MAHHADQLYEQFAAEVIQALPTWDGRPLGTHTEFRIQFLDDRWEPRFQPVKEYRRRSVEHIDDVKALPITRECIGVHLALGLLDQHPVMRIMRDEGAPEQRVREFALTLLLEPLGEALEEHGMNNHPLTAVMQKYRDYVLAWTATESRRVVRVPLLNFDAGHDVGPGELTPNFRLTELAADEKTALWNEWTIGTWEFNANTLARVRWQLRAEYLAPIGSHYQNRELQSEADRFLTALRLHQAGHVAFLVFAIDPAAHEEVSGTTRQVIAYPEHRIRQAAEYYLVNAEPVRRLDTQLEEIERTGRLHRFWPALRRFHFIYQRESSEDRIVDLTVAMESSLLARGEGEERIYHKEAVAERRAVALLGDRVPDLEDKIRILFWTRNAIVHDGVEVEQLSPEIRQLIEDVGWVPEFLTDYLADVVREALKAYLARLAEGADLPTINRSLDDQTRG